MFCEESFGEVKDPPTLVGPSIELLAGVVLMQILLIALSNGSRLTFCIRG
jgi:hypothetical protein